MISRPAFAGAWTSLLLGALSCVSIVPANAQSVTFDFDAPIDLGSNLDRVGNLNRWSHVLGTEWDANFRIGGIIGNKNATVIPEVPNPFPVGPNPLIHEVVADTRTGARMTGNVQGDVGLEFYADYAASGLESGAAFQFRPEIVNMPAQIPSGDFFQLQTVPGVVDNGMFTEELVDLPSFEAGMNFFFNLELDSRIEYGLFPFIPYGSTSFRPAPIHVNQNLIKFDFDLDPDSNGGVGLPPSFVILEDTPFENRIGLLDDSEFLAEKQFSVEVSNKEQPDVKRRLDIGSAHLVNPFGTGESLLGPNERNLTITTGSDASSVDYSFETPLLRLGLDLDGIAAFLATGQSFTRLEEEIKDSRDNTLVSITADFIDIKYGPEIGYRETLSINPDFDVTLSFDQDVALNDGSSITFGDSFTGKWSDLPQIALLGDSDVEVGVSFNQVTGEQTKRSVFYITDYLELTLLELEDLTVLETFSLSLPPVLQERISLLGDLLGQIELELTDTTETIMPFDVGANQMGASSFTLHAAPSERLYWNSASSDQPQLLDRWRQLDDHSTPGTFEGKTLTIGRGHATVRHAGELTPQVLDDAGTPDVSLLDLFVEQGGRLPLLSPANADQTFYADTREVIDAQSLEIVAGSEYHQSGLRRWKLGSIKNDGLYQSVGTTEIDRTDGLLQISGSGEMRFTQRTRVASPALFHGAGHTLRFTSVQGVELESTAELVRVTGDRSNPLERVTLPLQFQVNDRPLAITETIQNAGTIIFDDTSATIDLSSELGNAATGALRVLNNAELTLRVPQIVQNGLVEVAGDATTLIVDHPETFGQINIQSTSGAGRFVAADGATIRFLDTVLLSTPGVDEASAIEFNATRGGTIQFDGAIRAFNAGVAELNVDETSTLILSGVDVQRPNAQVSLVNKGLVEVQAGINRLYYDPPVVFDPDAPEPEIVGINIVNEGTIRIQPREGVSGPLFGFEAEIRNYVPGGAALGGGTWEVIGDIPANPYKNDEGGTFVLGQRTSVLEILIKSVSNDDTFLGTIDFGDTDGDGASDGYSAEDYDTRLAVSAANVLLSGAARFDYFNTIRENRGSLTLRNKNHFDTNGDLLNSGEIRIEAEARLNVNGDLTVDEGSVFVDATSALDVNGNTIEVIGGSVSVERGAGPLFVNTPWIVREKWVGVDEQGNDIVLEGRVSFGDAHFPAIGPNAAITLEGERAVFEPLMGLNRIEGALMLAGGNELHVPQNLTNAGTLKLATAAKLYVDGDLVSSGHVEIDADSYLDVTGGVSVTLPSQPAPEGTLIRLDGIVNAGSLDVGQGTTLRGTGRLVGALGTMGTLIAEVSDASSGSDQNQLLVDGQATLGGELQIELAMDSLPQASDAISVLSAAGLQSAFDNVSTGERLDTQDGYGSFAVFYGASSPFNSNEIILSNFEPDPLLGDYDGSGAIEQGDLDLVLLHWGTLAVPAPAGWNKFLPKGHIDQAELDRVLLNWGTSAANVSGGQAAVPEPAAGILAALLVFVAAASSRRWQRFRKLAAAAITTIHRRFRPVEFPIPPLTSAYSGCYSLIVHCGKGYSARN